MKLNTYILIVILPNTFWNWTYSWNNILPKAPITRMENWRSLICLKTLIIAKEAISIRTQWFTHCFGVILKPRKILVFKKVRFSLFDKKNKNKKVLIIFAWPWKNLFLNSEVGTMLNQDGSYEYQHLGRSVSITPTHVSLPTNQKKHHTEISKINA